jgi:hypothetical protein
MNELFQKNYESFQIVNMEDFGNKTTDSSSTNNDMKTITDMGNIYASNMQKENDNYVLLNSNLNTLAALRNEKINAINAEEENKLIARNPLMKPVGSDILQKAREEDSNIFLLEENYLYILGTITFAIVGIGAIVIARN